MAWSGETALTTERLTLRTFRRDDLPLYAALNRDPEVVRYLGGPITREYSDEIAEWANGLFDGEGIGLLAVERRSDQAFLGMCGLHHLETYPDDLEVAWRLAHQYWNQGYATEAARAWVQYGFNVKQASRIISGTDAENTRSLAVMRRLGMTFDHAAQVVEDGNQFDAVIYALAAPPVDENPEPISAR